MKFLLCLILVFPTIVFSQTPDSLEIPPPPSTVSQKEVKQGVVYDIVSVSPEYPGGPAEMSKFIQENFEYPENARELGEQGTVWIEFIVMADGTLDSIKVVKSVSESLDAECVKVISKMPKWSPGEHNGNAVNVRYTIPIKAVLDLGKKKKRLFRRN